MVLEMYIIFFSLVPLVAGAICFYTPENRVREVALTSSLITLVLCNGLFFYLSNDLSNSSTLVRVEFAEALNLAYVVKISGLSLCFVQLTGLLIPICILVSWVSITTRLKEFYIVLFLIEFFLFQVFLVDDLLLFYFFYECVVLPVFFLIVVWGSRERRVMAAFQFFFFTFLGSILMLIAILQLYKLVGSTDMTVVMEGVKELSFEQKKFIWLALFLAFAVKTPMFPVHSWLPEAHVEAPTAGSVLLAGILLKMGLYGMYKFLVLPFPEVSSSFFPLISALALFSLVYISLIILVQIDLKKIIAYASIAHMNFAVIGLFSEEFTSIMGGLYLLIIHGLVSSGLFICVGSLYDRYKTRIIYYYSGLDRVMPVFSFNFFILMLANMGLPFTGSFVAELLVFLGTLEISPLVVLILSTNIFFGAAYSVWLFSRMMFGNLNSYIREYCDVNRRESFVLGFLTFLTVFFGLCPTPVFNLLVL